MLFQNTSVEHHRQTTSHWFHRRSTNRFNAHSGQPKLEKCEKFQSGIFQGIKNERETLVQLSLILSLSLSLLRVVFAKSNECVDNHLQIKSIEFTSKSGKNSSIRILTGWLFQRQRSGIFNRYNCAVGAANGFDRQFCVSR